jgi:6-methylsalicylate decarboxylase
MDNCSVNRIDGHHHLIPPASVQVAERHEVRTVADTSLPDWSPEKLISVLDITGIQIALLSLSTPNVYFGDRAGARHVACASNV